MYNLSLTGNVTKSLPTVWNLIFKWTNREDVQKIVDEINADGQSVMNYGSVQIDFDGSGYQQCVFLVICSSKEYYKATIENNSNIIEGPVWQGRKTLTMAKYF